MPYPLTQEVVVGSRGPVGKRSDQKLGHRAKAEAEAVTKSPSRGVPVAPEPDGSWHPIAARWFESLGASGQARFYEASDWTTAYFVAESMSRDLGDQYLGMKGTGEGRQEPFYGTIPLKGASLAAYLKAMSNLLVTEGDRRRASLELQRGPAVDDDEDASVASMADWRERLA